MELELSTRMLMHYGDKRRLEPIRHRSMKIFLDYSSPLQPRKREQASVSYMHDSDVSDDDGCVRQPAVYPIATLMEPKPDERQIIEHDFTPHQEKDSNFQQASSTLGILGSAYNYDSNGLLTCVLPIYDVVQKPFLRHYEHVFYITQIIEVW